MGTPRANTTSDKEIFQGRPTSVSEVLNRFGLSIKQAFSM